MAGMMGGAGDEAAALGLGAGSPDEEFWKSRLMGQQQAGGLMTGDPGQPIEAGVGVLNPGAGGGMHQMPDGSMMPGAEHPGGMPGGMGGEGGEGGVLADVIAYLRRLGIGGGR